MPNSEQFSLLSHLFHYRTELHHLRLLFHPRSHERRMYRPAGGAWQAVAVVCLPTPCGRDNSQTRLGRYESRSLLIA